MSSKLHLRIMEPEDLEDVFQIENDSDLWEVSTNHGPYSHRVVTDFVLNSTGDIAKDGQMRFMVETDEGVVGTLDFTDYNAVHQRAEIGVAIKREFRGSGYAREAVNLAVDYARDYLLLHQLYVLVHAKNTVSLNLFRQLGFNESGLLQQWYRSPSGFEDVYVLQLFL